MAFDADKLNTLLLAVEKLTFQMGRLLSDFESEKEFRKERNDEVNRRLDSVEAWKNKWHGAFIAMSIILTVLTILGFVVKF